MKRGTLTALLLALGAALTGIGCLLGQHSAVMAKAVRVCLECVGIG